MVSICDGTKQNGTRNCGDPSRWLVCVAGEGGHYSSACDRHLVQVSRQLLDGEAGKLEVHNLHTDEH